MRRKENENLNIYISMTAADEDHVTGSTAPELLLNGPQGETVCINTQYTVHE